PATALSTKVPVRVLLPELEEDEPPQQPLRPSARAAMEAVSKAGRRREREISCIEVTPLLFLLKLPVVILGDVSAFTASPRYAPRKKCPDEPSRLPEYRGRFEIWRALTAV